MGFLRWERELSVDDLNRPLITGPLECLIQSDVTVTRQREREFFRCLRCPKQHLAAVRSQRHRGHIWIGVS